jgi:hypothetical protein
MPTDQQDEKATHDPAKWLVATEIAKFEGDWTGEQIDAGEAPEPFEVLRTRGTCWSSAACRCCGSSRSATARRARWST